jgi:hypothetical protein
VASSDEERELPIGRAVPVTLRVELHREATAIATRVRATGGLEVDGGALREHGSLQKGSVVERTILLAAPGAIAGYLVVDVSVTSDGRRTSGSVPIYFHAPRARPRGLAQGELSKDPTGRSIVVLPLAEK